MVVALPNVTVKWVQPSIIDNLPNSPQQPVYKLYLPLHRSYYLVTASLVCRHFGLPDHTVKRKDGEKVSFLLRRLMNVNGVTAEYGWIDNQKQWQRVPSGQVLPGEERLPLHPIKVQPQPL